MTYSNPSPGAFSPAPEPTPRRRSGLGAAALLLALIALLFAWMPFVGLIMVIPAVLAILIGIVGFAGATASGKVKRGLPLLATLVGASVLVVAPASTAIGLVCVVPWGVAIASDGVQAELEHNLRRDGVPDDRALRISTEVGESLRRYAHPGNWREGIDFVHRLGLVIDEYERKAWQIEPGDLETRARLAVELRENLATLAQRFGADLTAADLEDVVRVMQKSHDDHRAARERHRQTMSRCGIAPAMPVHFENTVAPARCFQ